MIPVDISIAEVIDNTNIIPTLNDIDINSLLWD